MPYCGFCGTKQPSEKRAQAMGLAVYGATNGKQSTRDLDDISAFLTKHHGKSVRLWNYFVSHCELEMRLRHSGGPDESKEPWLNTVINCTSTEQIRLPTFEWDSALTIEAFEGKYSPVYVLSDLSAEVRIECGGIRLYFDIEPGM